MGEPVPAGERPMIEPVLERDPIEVVAGSDPVIFRERGG
jgi:hypothetical protein